MGFIDKTPTLTAFGVYCGEFMNGSKTNLTEKLWLSFDMPESFEAVKQCAYNCCCSVNLYIEEKNKRSSETTDRQSLDFYEAIARKHMGTWFRMIGVRPPKVIGHQNRPLYSVRSKDYALLGEIFLNCKSNSITETANNALYNLIELSGRIVNGEKFDSFSALDFSLFKKTHNLFNHILDAESKGQAIISLQILNSPNDHLSNHHTITTQVKPIIYYDKHYNCISTFTAAVQYCEHCNMYFDFSESFFIQLEKVGIKKEYLLTTILDNLGNKQNFRNIKNIHYTEMREYSELYLYGYTVKEGVLTTKERQYLLDEIIKKGFMSVASVKKHINYLLKRPQTRNTNIAVQKWRHDLQYINEQVKSGVYINM